MSANNSLLFNVCGPDQLKEILSLSLNLKQTKKLQPYRLPYLGTFATTWGERGRYLTMGNDVSSIAEEQSHNQTVSTKAQLLKIGEPKRNRTDVRQLTRPAPYR